MVNSWAVEQVFKDCGKTIPDTNIANTIWV